MSSRPKTSLDNIETNLDEFRYFCIEREKARLWKTDDPIIKRYKFTNLNRFDDRMTKFIIGWGDEMIHFVWARHINYQPVLEAIKISPTVETIRQFKPRYRNPYQCPCALYTVNKFKTREEWLFNFLPEKLKDWKPLPTILENVQWMNKQIGWNNNFAFQQAVLDYAWKFGKIDLNSPVYVGPGAVQSLRALNMTMEDFATPPFITEHSLCEFRKYLEIKHNLTKFRKVYKPYKE